MGLLFLTAAEDNNFPRIISSWSAIKLPASKLNYGYSWSENNFAHSSPSPPSSFSALFHVPYFFHHIGFWRFSLLVFDDSELISALSSCFYCCLMLFLHLLHHQLSSIAFSCSSDRTNQKFAQNLVTSYDSQGFFFSKDISMFLFLLFLSHMSRSLPVSTFGMIRFFFAVITPL